MNDKTDKEKELMVKVQPLSEDLRCSEEGKEQYKIGELYRRGWKVFKDENKAIDYYLHAINKNMLKRPKPGFSRQCFWDILKQKRLIDQ